LFILILEESLSIFDVHWQMFIPTLLGDKGISIGIAVTHIKISGRAQARVTDN
jgi:hypothetical protein